MKNKLKHNKIKNSGVIFECLIKQITSDLIVSENNNKSTNLIKRIFNKNSEMLKEVQLYQSVFSNTKINNEQNANVFIEYLLNEYDKINKIKLNKEKFNAIKNIKESYNLEEFFNTKIENYTTYASLYKIFSYSKLTESINPSELMENRINLVNFLMRKNNDNKNQKVITENEKLLQDFNKLTPKTKELAYKLYINKFNETYSKTFNKNQKNLIRAYMFDSVDFSFKKYINDKIPTIKSKLLSINEKNKDNQVLITKINEINTLLDKIQLKKELKPDNIVALMEIYELFEQFGV